MLNSPHNPTGQLIGAEQWDAVAALCRRHDLWLVSDEVYAELIFEGEHTCAASLPGMAERTVVINSLSKSHAMTGWRLGWVLGPEALIGHMSHLALCMLYGCPEFIQDAACSALEQEPPELDAMRNAYRCTPRRRLHGPRRLPSGRCHHPGGRHVFDGRRARHRAILPGFRRPAARRRRRLGALRRSLWPLRRRLRAP